MKYLAPDYIYTPQGIERNMLVTITDDGRISTIEKQDSEATQVLVTDNTITRLPDTLLLPGFVNAHSHVFQRALRGHTHRPLAEHDSFWTWRQAMYAEAQCLTPDSLYEGALRTYREMLAAGYTTVGEFHYVHHQPNGQPYDNPNAMSEAVLAAAREAGIRIVLLMTAYAQSGFHLAPEEGQRRFCDRSVNAYLQRVEDLRVKGVAIGVAPHSIRAVPEEWFRAIADYSHMHNISLHVHADEQNAEIEQCQASYGCTPIELLERFGALGPHTTIIHATHANETELGLLAHYGCTVCVCPTTEGDLGDGIAPYDAFMQKDILLAIGADSNTRLDPFEELRWAEYSARMRYQRRRVLVCEQLASPGPLLLDIGTHGGAVALQQETGILAPGMRADFIAIDLNHPSLYGWTEEDILDVLFFGAASNVIKNI
ncbi:MAG: formimidoylglutamate deiminase [Ktedonobacteraceae bacterium]